MKTAVIQIGNSDNKLLQAEWSEFCAAVRRSITDYCVTHQVKIHFEGGSNWDAKWQNACWIFEIKEDQIDQMKRYFAKLARDYAQESIAVIVGETEFIQSA